MNASQNPHALAASASHQHSPIGVRLPRLFLADDATSADQIALSLSEALGKNVVTIDTRCLSHKDLPIDDCQTWVINSGTRALSEDQAHAHNEYLATHIFSREKILPVLQIDSRLRGISKAIRGFYNSTRFAFLFFVPAEPELGRLVRDGIYYHAEAGRLIPFHQSLLAASAESPANTSDLRQIIARELAISTEQVFSINVEVVSRGPDAIADCIRGIHKGGKCIVIPDVTGPEHFEAVIAARQRLGPDELLMAGSRTFLRALFASSAASKVELSLKPLLSQAIDRRKKGAPLAIISSLEPTTNKQIEYAQRALGPNLVTVILDSSVVSADDSSSQRETERARHIVINSLKAMRHVLLQSSRKQVSADPAFHQKCLHAISNVIAGEGIHHHVTSLFLCGGQTAETIKDTLGVTALEIKGPFQEGVPWGIPTDGALQRVPIVTKGGRLGNPNVLFKFFEQGHPLPRANIVPVVTPLTKDRQIDDQGIAHLITHLAYLGATDIFAVGNAGEFRFLRNEQRLEALESFAKHAEGKVRVFAGVTGDTAPETRSNYEKASKLGVYAAVIMPLYFLDRSSDIGPFIESLRSDPSGLPVVLYNNPARTKGHNIAFEEVEALQFPVIAVKDSSGDLNRLDRYINSMPVYEGQQRQFMEGYLHGAIGTIGIIGHVSSLPNEFFDPLTTASRRESIAKEINDLSKAVKQCGAEVAAYKFVLSLMGIMGDTVASDDPARALTSTQREQIRFNNAALVSNILARSPSPFHRK